MNTSSPDKIYSVSELSAQARHVLEGAFASLVIEGEISNFVRPASGHWYFSIKDDSAQIRCAMFRGNNRRVHCQPRDGLQVQLRARVSLYAPRGTFQLICQSMEPAGEGALRLAFEQLKTQLADEGLFDAQYKQPLPERPRTIAVVTSQTGAAVRDILSTLARRWPLARVRLYPTLVQGTPAAANIAAAIVQACKDEQNEVLIVARGGGSLEDLWAFNEEVVARAIHAATLPVIAGVGHETDTTITDFVADYRAPTPTGAAEAAVPDQQDIIQYIDGIDAWLTRDIGQHLARGRERLNWTQQRLNAHHPQTRLTQQAQRLAELSTRLQQGGRTTIALRRSTLARLGAELKRFTPTQQLHTRRAELRGTQQRLHNALQQRLTEARARQQLLAHQLRTVSPLATLERGYAIVSDAQGHALTQATTVHAGDHITARLAQGQLHAEVCHIDNHNSE